jgi:nucleotide-binding universal stress UspA family protein
MHRSLEREISQPTPERYWSAAELPIASSTPISFQNVLMATDFSKCSDLALRIALDIARRYGATLQLFHWVDPTIYNMVGPGALQAASQAAWRDIQRLDMDLLVQGFLKDIREKVLVEDGDLSQVLSRVISERKIDLIVLGTHGRTGLRKLILGSVAEKIFRQASCPVLTVGPQSRRIGQAEPRSILFPTDFSPRSQVAETYALGLAGKYGSRLTLLHVSADEGGGGLDENERRDWIKRQVETLAGREKAISGNPDLIVKIGSPVDVILRVADERQADLIVLGVRAPYSLADRLMWPNAYRIVCESRCPVLTVRALR